MHTKIIFFDMDGVLTVEKSCWHYVHSKLGVDNSINYQKYVKKEITYEEFFKLDINLWISMFGEMRKETVVNILKQIRIRDCVSDLIKILRNEHIRSIIISGGISWLADYIKEKYSFDEAYANEILTDGHGYIIPEGKIKVIPDKKNLIIKDIVKKYNVKKEETISVGDSTGDYSMYMETGKFFSFNTDDVNIKKISSGNIDKNLMEIIRYID